jgi:hypothetical protein
MTTNDPSEGIEVWISAPRTGTLTQRATGFEANDEVETHSKAVDKVIDAVKVNSQEFLESWKKAFQAVEALFVADGGSGAQSTFVLDSVTARLSLTATGKVAFVGELGGEIAFEAQFKRR